MSQMSRVINSGMFYRPRSHKRRKPRSLGALARELQENPPLSEIWFKAYYRPYRSKAKLKLYRDCFNEIIGSKYIIDVLNRGYRYAIEVDGSYHTRPDQKLKDKAKDAWLKKLGYRVIRVTAHSGASFNKAIDEIKWM